MDEWERLKPPSLGMWLILVCGATILGAAWTGEPFQAISAWTFFASGCIALWVISGWIGRWLAWLYTHIMIGWNRPLPGDDR